MARPQLPRPPRMQAPYPLQQQPRFTYLPQGCPDVRPPPPWMGPPFVDVEAIVADLRRETATAAATAAANAASAATARAVESMKRAVAAQFGASNETARLEVQATMSRIEQRVEGIEQSLSEDHLGRVVAATSEAAPAALREAMAASLTPAIEAAIRACFAQMDHALRERLKVHDGVESERLKRFDGVWSSLTAQIDDLKARFDDLALAVGRRPASKDLVRHDDGLGGSAQEEYGEEEGHPRDVREEIAELVEAMDYDTAVYKAVECGDVSVLIYAVVKIGVDNVNDSTLPFQQPTLLCLIQQLGTTIDRADHADFVPLKLDWLQLAILGLDPSHHQIAIHVPNVLRQVKHSLETLPPTVDTAQYSAPVKILVHVINSLLK